MPQAAEAVSPPPSLYIKVFPDGKRLVCLAGACFQQALLNKAYGPEMQSLKLVVGSLGLGTTEPFFEYGGAQFRTVHDFVESACTKRDEDGRMRWDSHVWLEDEAGSVHDIVTPHMAAVASSKGKGVGFAALDVMGGVPKAQLHGRGLWYVPADADAQAVMLAILGREWRGEAEWIERVVEGSVVGSLSPAQHGKWVPVLLKRA